MILLECKENSSNQTENYESIIEYIKVTPRPTVQQTSDPSTTEHRSLLMEIPNCYNDYENWFIYFNIKHQISTFYLQKYKRLLKPSNCRTRLV